MNQNKLQQKRRKRQAKRKDAQARARRAGLALGEKQKKDALRARQPHQPGWLGRALGQGTQITPDQPDAVAAPIITGGL